MNISDWVIATKTAGKLRLIDPENTHDLSQTPFYVTHGVLVVYNPAKFQDFYDSLIFNSMEKNNLLYVSPIGSDLIFIKFSNQKIFRVYSKNDGDFIFESIQDQQKILESTGKVFDDKYKLYYVIDAEIPKMFELPHQSHTLNTTTESQENIHDKHEPSPCNIS